LIQSSNVDIPPFAITGIVNDYLIFLMIFQLHEPTSFFFYSFVLPWTTNILQPASYIALTNFNVASSLGRHLILQVTGTLRFWANI
jgi:hypothetical protein